ncbi:MAG: PQQ-dependent sugar dehydrogenase [Acidimicrobiales bacterium]
MLTRTSMPTRTSMLSRTSMLTMACGAVIVAALAVSAGCSDSADVAEEARASELAPEAAEVRVETVHEGLLGPTQLIVLDDKTFIVATINGGENDQLGQVLRIDRPSGTTEVLRENLDKPTGIAVIGDELWVMERDRLTRGPLDGDTEPAVVVDDLPNNGRSEGTLTVTPDGLVLFDTSGAKFGGDVVEGSGRLFTVDPTERPGTPTELASGFKHAYAHVFDEAGVLWTTEMTDGSFDGQPAGDEVVAVEAGADHGWPRCVENNRAVVEFGGDDKTCAETPESIAVFGVGATPTSVALSPFEAGVLLVSLWNEGRIVQIDTTSSDASAVGDLLAGLDRPQHLVSTDDALYATEFGSGRILRVTMT